MEAPKRKYEVHIKVSGDTWDDVLGELEYVANEIAIHGEDCASVSGGYSTNHTVQITKDPNMTHDIFIEKLNEYLDSLRKKEMTIIYILVFIVIAMLWLLWNPQVLRDVVSYLKYP